jgi:glycosyltransferase involved in cell wall biosynthesis
VAVIVSLIAGHLCNAPRPVKEAAALTRAGHTAIVAGFWYDPYLATYDVEIAEKHGFEFVEYAHAYAHDWAKWWRPQQFQRRLAVWAWRYGKIALPSGFGYAAGAATRLVRRYRPDLCIAHSEMAIGLLQKPWKLNAKRVGVDFEDWFSRDLPAEVRVRRPNEYLARWESNLLKSASVAFAPSVCMAHALGDACGAKPPTVVYNSFPLVEADPDRSDRGDDPRVSLHWYSQTIGPGRGLETLFEALGHVQSDVVVYLRGNLRDDMERQINALPDSVRDRIHVCGTVDPDELARLIAGHDIGLALEQTDIPSRDLTVTNKLFQYMAGGLPVIATATRGQCEVLERHAPGCGLIVPPGDVTALARAIDELASDEARRRTMGAAARAAMTTGPLSWSENEQRLVAAVEEALRTS